MLKELISERNYKAGYVIRTELIDGAEYGGEDFEMKSAYNSNGDYIGNSKNAHFLCKKKGIRPEVSKPDHSVCSIGFCGKEQKWYGWSHRAIFGFGIGSTVKKGDCAYTPTTVDELYAEREEWYSDFNDPHKHMDCTEKDYENNRLIIHHEMVNTDSGTMPSNIADACDTVINLDGSAVEIGEPAEPQVQYINTGRGEWTAETLSDAWQMAIDFAESVS